MRLLVTFAGLLLLSACTGMPKGVEVVDDFELESYLGTWYEVARLDHGFERGMSNVTATYSLRDDGGLKVVNRGYRDAKGKWDDATGKAYFVDRTDVGHLKVSFFGPFYGGYNIMALDPERFSLVAGPTRGYLWVLSRTPTLDKAVLDELVAKAELLGFDTSELIFVEHDRAE